MSKKKKIILVIASVSVIVTAFLGGSSFSKYAAQIKGEAVADIACWNFKVNEQSEQMATINLVSENNDNKISQNKIAPGTSGYFTISIDASRSEVGINYNVSIENEQNKPQNLKFYYDGTPYDSLKDLEEILTGTINANDEEKVINYTIHWQWLYTTGENDKEIEKNDIIDTQDANKGNYTCDILVTGSQVDPLAND